jgi:hypothetical protein
MPGLLDYYPSEKYISKNWKPEQVPVSSLRALANAQMLAQKNQLLPPELAATLLPNALVEGRFASEEGGPADFGFNFFGYPHAPELENTMMKMGLKVGASNYPPKEVTSNWGDGQWEDWSRKQPKFDVYKVDNGYTLNPDDYEDPSHSEEAAAKMAAIALAYKARLYGNDKAIERWNGQGAGARNHARKVQEMIQMLNNPKNAQIRDTYRGLLGE